MSRSSKNEKYNCLANCLPMKGCLQRSKRRPSIPSGVASVEYNLTDGSGKMESAFGQQDSKSAQTKQWLHNVSTVATFDPSCANESNLDSTLSDSPSKKENRHHGGHNACRSAGGCDCHHHSGARNNRQDGRQSHEDDRGGGYAHVAQRHPGSGATNEGGAPTGGMNESYVDCRCCDCCRSSSSSQNDSSQLSSNCYSQKREGRRRRIYEHTSSSLDESSSTAYARYKQRLNNTADSSSICSSTLSLSTEAVTLDMDACHHLGITIVGHSNAGGDTGIYIGCIKKNGAVARCGRVEPGDLILNVNGVNLEQMKNEDALATMKKEVAKGGLVRIVVGKYWDMTPEERGVVKGNDVHMESLYETVGSVRSLSIAPSKKPASSDVVGSEGYYTEPQGKTGNVLKAIPDDNRAATNRQFHEATGMSSADLERLFDLSKAARKFGFGAKQPPPQQGSSISHMSSGSSSRGATPFPDSGYEARCVTSAGSCHSLLQQSMAAPDHRLGHTMMGAGSNGGGLAMVGLGGSGGDSARGGSSVAGVPSSSFCGMDLVNWIQSQVVGLRGRKEAVAYAQNLLRTGHIRNADPRQGDIFQENVYYAFGPAQQRSADPVLQSKML